MAYNISLTHNNQVLTCVVSGDISFEQLKQSLADRVAFPGSEKCQVWFADYSGADVSSISRDDIMRIVGLGASLNRERPDVHLVALMPGALTYGMSRMAQSFSSEAVAGRTLLARTPEAAERLIAQCLANLPRDTDCA